VLPHPSRQSSLLSVLDAAGFCLCWRAFAPLSLARAKILQAPTARARKQGWLVLLATEKGFPIKVIRRYSLV
jgi:hypothetical protein